MRSNRSRRLLAPLLVAACMGVAACGGSDEDDVPDTQVVVPEQTVAPEVTEVNGMPVMDGYLLSATPKRVVLRTQSGDETLRVSRADAQALGIGHMASHAGVPSIGFRLYYEEIDGKRFVKGAEEIPPPF